MKIENIIIIGSNLFIETEQGEQYFTNQLKTKMIENQRNKVLIGE